MKKKQDFINELIETRDGIYQLYNVLDKAIIEAESVEELTEDKQIEITVKIAIGIAKITK